MKNGRRLGRTMGAAGLALLLASGAAAEQRKDGGRAVMIRPDLRVVRVEAERTGINSNGSHRVQVRATIINAAVGAVCAGQSLLRVEKRSPGGAYTPLGEQNAPRLCADPSRSRPATATLNFEDAVPVGQQRLWRATADATGVVTESREDNNRGESEVYVAKSLCPGVDLDVTRAEVVRGRSGVFIKVFGRNRCGGSCAGNVQAVFDVAAPPVSWLAATQRVGSSAGPLQEYESGSVGVYSSAETAVTYRVGIEFEGGTCSDATPGNNFCEVTFGPTESRRVFTCP